jgi:hypothetical protein
MIWGSSKLIWAFATCLMGTLDSTVVLTISKERMYGSGRKQGVCSRDLHELVLET